MEGVSWALEGREKEVTWVQCMLRFSHKYRGEEGRGCAR